MKKISFFVCAAALALASTFTSCSNEDNNFGPNDIVVRNGYELADIVNKNIAEATGDEVIVTLPAKVTLFLDSAIVVPENVKLTIEGDEAEPATVIIKKNDANIIVSNALTVKNVNIDAAELAQPLVKLNTLPAEAELTKEGFLAIDGITLDNVQVSNLSNILIDGNRQKYLLDQVKVANSVILVDATDKAIINFNGGGVAAKVTVDGSTIACTTEGKHHTGFVYTSQSGQKATEAGLEEQVFEVLNSTYYNLAYGKNIYNHRQNSQKWLKYVVKNVLAFDCGKAGQFLKGLNNGGQSANPTYEVEKLLNLRAVDGVIVDQTAQENTNGKGTEVVGADYQPLEGVTFANIAEGDFHNATGFGDPRWLK